MDELLRYAKFYNLSFSIVGHPSQPRFILTLFTPDGDGLAMGEGETLLKAVHDAVARAGDEYPALDWA